MTARSRPRQHKRRDSWSYAVLARDTMMAALADRCIASKSPGGFRVGQRSVRDDTRQPEEQARAGGSLRAHQRSRPFPRTLNEHGAQEMLNGTIPLLLLPKTRSPRQLHVFPDCMLPSMDVRTPRRDPSHHTYYTRASSEEHGSTERRRMCLCSHASSNGDDQRTRWPRQLTACSGYPACRRPACRPEMMAIQAVVCGARTYQLAASSMTRHKSLGGCAVQSSLDDQEAGCPLGRAPFQRCCKASTRSLAGATLLAHDGGHLVLS